MFIIFLWVNKIEGLEIYCFNFVCVKLLNDFYCFIVYDLLRIILFNLWYFEYWIFCIESNYDR